MFHMCILQCFSVHHSYCSLSASSNQCGHSQLIFLINKVFLSAELPLTGCFFSLMHHWVNTRPRCVRKSQISCCRNTQTSLSHTTNHTRFKINEHPPPNPTPPWWLMSTLAEAAGPKRSYLRSFLLVKRHTPKCSRTPNSQIRLGVMKKKILSH